MTDKPLYNKPSAWRKFTNSISPVARTSLILGFYIALALMPSLYRSHNYCKIIQKKNRWVEEEVCNMSNSEYAKLDIEEEPLPLIPQSK